nr:hypothetical protein [Colwellia sp. MB3u-55]
MPEFTISVMAVLRKHKDLAVVDVAGSNIFNILGILGVSSLISLIFPKEDLPSLISELSYLLLWSLKVN